MQRLLILSLAAAACVFGQGSVFPPPSGTGGTGAPNATATLTSAGTQLDIPHTFSVDAAQAATITCYAPGGSVLTDWTRSDPNSTTIRITFAASKAIGTRCSANGTGTGARGFAGLDGQPGVPGTAATVAIGAVSTGAPGSSAAVTNAGSSNAAVLNITIPRGADGTPGAAGSPGATGQAATVAVGTVTTGAPGTAASVTNAGNSNSAVLNITIPRGADGNTGPAGPTDYALIQNKPTLPDLGGVLPLNKIFLCPDGQGPRSNGTTNVCAALTGGGTPLTLNGLNDASQSLAASTAGSTVSWTSSGGTHTINIPLSATGVTGLLSGADRTSLFAKENALTFSGGLSRSGNTVNLPQANGSTNGFLSSTDFSAFTAKENPLSFGGVLARSGNAVSLAKATASIPGYLDSVDFASFAGKENPLSFSGVLSRSGNAVSIAQANGSTSGFLAAADFSTFLAKENALTFSGVLSRSSNTVSIPKATGSVAGYLDSVDFASFAAKETALTFSGVLSRSGNTITIPQASGSVGGFLSSTDFTTFNNKQSTAAKNTINGYMGLGSDGLADPAQLGAGSATTKVLYGDKQYKTPPHLGAGDGLTKTTAADNEEIASADSSVARMFPGTGAPGSFPEFLRGYFYLDDATKALHYATEDAPLGNQFLKLLTSVPVATSSVVGGIRAGTRNAGEFVREWNTTTGIAIYDTPIPPPPQAAVRGGVYSSAAPAGQVARGITTGAAVAYENVPLPTSTTPGGMLTSVAPTGQVGGGINTSGGLTYIDLPFPSSTKPGGVTTAECPAGQYSYGRNTDGTPKCRVDQTGSGGGGTARTAANGAPPWLPFGVAQSATGTLPSSAAKATFLYRIWVPESTDLSKFRIRVTVAAATGTAIKMGIYNAACNSLLAQAPAIVDAVVGQNEVALASTYTLSPGAYNFAFAAEDNATIRVSMGTGANSTNGDLINTTGANLWYRGTDSTGAGSGFTLPTSCGGSQGAMTNYPHVSFVP